MKKERYIVELIRPAYVSKTEMAEYIEEAIGSWKGGKNPDEDPITELDHETVKCFSERKSK